MTKRIKISSQISSNPPFSYFRTHSMQFHSILSIFLLPILLWFPVPVEANSFAFPLESLPLVIRNKMLKYFIYHDLQTLKRFSVFRVQAMEKMNEIYQALLSSYYDASAHYYGMSESDIALMDKLTDLL